MVSNDILPFSNFNAGSECLLNNESVSDIDRLRLVMLYALRYEKESPEFIFFVYRKRYVQKKVYNP